MHLDNMPPWFDGEPDPQEPDLLKKCDNCGRKFPITVFVVGTHEWADCPDCRRDI